MTEEQIAARKIYAGGKKPSMKRRDDHHDYSERLMYMITLEICKSPSARDGAAPSNGSHFRAVSKEGL